MWPSTLSYRVRLERLQAFCVTLAKALPASGMEQGHPLEISLAFKEKRLPAILAEENARHADQEAGRRFS